VEKTKLAAANRSRITKTFGQDRWAWSTVGNFSRIQFDHHRANLVADSHAVCARVGSSKILGTLGPNAPTLRRMDDLLEKRPIPTCCRTKFGRSRSNRMGVGRRGSDENLWTMGRGPVSPLETLPAPTSVSTANLVILGQTVGARNYDDPLEKSDPSSIAFRGQWN